MADLKRSTKHDASAFIFSTAILLLNKNGEPMERFDGPDDSITMDFITPGLILTSVAIVYALVIVVARRKKKRTPFSYTYWLVLGSGIAILLVPFASVTIESVIDYFHR